MARVAAYNRPTDIKKTFKELLFYLGHYKYFLILISFLVVVAGVANLIGTFSIKWLISYVQADDQKGMIRLIVLIAINYLIGSISTFSYTQMMVIVSQKVVKDMRNDLFTKVDKLPVKYFDTTEYGNIMSCFTNDIETVSEALNNAFAAIIDNFVQLVGTLICMFLLTYQLTLIVLVFYLIMAIYLVFAGKKSKKYFLQQQNYLGKLSGFSEEAIRGIKVIKVFNHEEETLKEFGDLNDKLATSSKRALFFANSMVPIVMAISYFNYALVTILGGIFVLNKTIDISVLSPYLVFVRQSSMPINRFTQQSNIILNSLASCERIFALIGKKAEIDEGTIQVDEVDDNKLNRKFYWRFPNQKDGVEIKGDVRFENVCFSYDGKNLVLNDISLYAKPGQKIAFVGSTGAGKTTITNLISRFYDVDSGKITYDGIDIKDIKKDDLRKTLGMVLQDTHLFTGSIEENIKFGKLNASHQEVVAAAKLANADSFIRRLPNGYNTILTSDGSNLSQGQRQLIAIARAAISNPKVLILDEATASVDTYTEKLIQQGMDKLMENRTVFVIAHRLSTVRNANAIIVLEHGKIIERGDHDDLLNQKGRYYQLYTGMSELE